MRLRLISLACLLLGQAWLLSACRGPADDPAVSAEVVAASGAAVSRPPPGVAQAARKPEPAPVLPARMAAQAAVGPRGTGGRGPRRQWVEPDPPFRVTPVASLDQPWAMTFLPDGRALVTEKPGRLRLVEVTSGRVGTVSGVPAVAAGGQGGLGDVVLHPAFGGNRLVYLSYVERSGNLYGAVVVRARLETDAAGGGHLSQLQRIWEQVPKTPGQGHFGHRLAFDAGRRLWITSGDRQQLDPAQDMGGNLGKILRLADDGSVPADNPFVAQGGVAGQVWSLGHRNPLGIAFDAQGRLWAHEMGPAGGDELNLILRGRNYGWPIVSNGDHYDGRPIPDHATQPGFEAPKAWWTPVIAPAGLVIYSGHLFESFRGDAFIGGLASQALVRVRFDGTRAFERRRYPMGRRIREVEQGPDGALWLLEDGPGGRLLRLTPPG